ncbi:MAG: antibiotic biosynthesis monooxygenase [Betaproteobacteria bacterium]|jgi:quinol monooxygenase YgiN|nr:antibiotic biosynthesis monooxygenase [Betaproteobacteria bacterium]
MIHVVAVITAKPGERTAILDAFRANVPAVLAEDGCIEYSAVIDTANGPAFQTPAGPDTFMVIEKWASLEALQAHATAPHMAAYAAKARPHIANRVVHVLSSAL